jgi:hypothetical protein
LNGLNGLCQHFLNEVSANEDQMESNY